MKTLLIAISVSLISFGVLGQTSKKKLAIGSMAPEIIMPDTNGKMVSLSSFRGKVVLIDFWASWCGPCESALPHVVEMYKKYKNKNFTVFSVSLDKDKEHWLKAIHEFGLTWTQVSDLKYWGSEAADIYDITSIPYTILVSKDGKIVKKKLSEKTMDQEIGQLVNN